MEAQKLQFEAIDGDPQLQELKVSGLKVWSGASLSIIYPEPSMNHLFRAHHDHIHLSSGLGFNLEEEIQVTKLGLAQLQLQSSELLSRLYWLDNVGQQLSFYQNGAFPQDQMSFILSSWNNPSMIRRLS